MILAIPRREFRKRPVHRLDDFRGILSLWLGTVLGKKEVSALLVGPLPENQECERMTRAFGLDSRLYLDYNRYSAHSLSSVQRESSSDVEEIQHIGIWLSYQRVVHSLIIGLLVFSAIYTILEQLVHYAFGFPV